MTDQMTETSKLLILIETVAFLICFCSFDPFCSILEKDNFIENLYIVLYCLIKKHSFF